MWLKKELVQLTYLLPQNQTLGKNSGSPYKLNHSLADFLEPDEIHVIQQNGTRFQNLKNDIIIPKHSNAIKTIILKRLAINIDVSKWLASIADCLLFQDMFVSFAFRRTSSR